MKRKILLTGVDVRPVRTRGPTAGRPNFTGLLWESLRDGDGNEVHWKEPSAALDRARPGRVRPSSSSAWPRRMAMGANRLYGALSVIGRLWEHAQADHPRGRRADPDLLTRGLRSVHANPRVS